jgi:hypothetical protein
MTWKSSFSREEIGKDLVRLVENKKIVTTSSNVIKCQICHRSRRNKMCLLSRLFFAIRSTKKTSQEESPNKLTPFYLYATTDLR